MDKQQIKAKFFGAHIGCEVITDVFHKNESPVLLESIGLYSNGTPFFSVRLNGSVVSGCSFSERNCKLVLRPLPSITDEEVAHCEGIGKSMQRSKWNDNAVGLAIGDYLRSINICLPFCGYDPIAEGWAVLEEKIPANEAQKTT